MPFVPNMQDEEQQQTSQGTSPVGGGGAVHLAPSSGVGSAPAQGGAAPTAAQGAGGSFATLNKYLEANQGQAEPLAGKITGQIGQQYGQLGQESQGVIQNLQGQVANAPGYTASNPDILAQEAANPVSFASNPENVAAFQKQATSQYTGPTSAEGTTDFQNQQAKINQAISQGQTQTGTEAGREQLVSQNTARPTTGAVALNAAILSQDPNSLGKVESAYQPFQNLVTGLQTGASNVNQQISKEQADAAAASKAAQDAITGQMTGLNTAVQNQLTQAQSDATTREAAVKGALGAGKVDASTLAALGITQDQWNALDAARQAA